MKLASLALAGLGLALGLALTSLAAEPKAYPGHRMMTEYFAAETAKLRDACLADVKTLADWDAQRETRRAQLAEMLGVDVQDRSTDLKATITGKVETEFYTVEKVHFQSRPGLYVTGNLYVPKNLTGRAPGILYVCGHARFVENGVAYGNKVSYRKHGDWFAKNGYVCLMIDTLQLGEIEGTHHGTYGVRRGSEWENQWWWIARGYTSAGVEAWNCIRALDYLETRPEVDPKRLGVTGRSGGGAYSWWVSALDERIKCSVPVAGITDLENHIVDGCVAGHCDCMFQVNTYRWDYPLVPALVAPRPLLLSNTDRDGIFPLDGVYRTQFKAREIYSLYGEPELFGLQITSGPHKDTQELRTHAFRWFNTHFKNTTDLIVETEPESLTPQQLKVFDELPADEINTTVHEVFVPKADEPQAPASAEQWATQRDERMQKLAEKTFRGWPQQAESLRLKEAFQAEHDGVSLTAYDFTSQGPVALRLYVARPTKVKPADLKLTVLNVLDQPKWEDWLGMMKTGFAKPLTAELEAAGMTEAPAAAEEFAQTQKMFANFPWGMAYIAPRGFGLTEVSDENRYQTQMRRRFYLLGQTWEGMQVYDVRRAIQALRSLDGMAEVPLWLQGEKRAAGIALYASLFEPEIVRLDLWHLPASHREGPIFMNVLKTLDMPQAVALAGERSQVILYQTDKSTPSWDYPRQVAEKLNWPEKSMQIRAVPAGE